MSELYLDSVLAELQQQNQELKFLLSAFTSRCDCRFDSPCNICESVNKITASPACANCGAEQPHGDERALIQGLCQACFGAMIQVERVAS